MDSDEDDGSGTSDRTGLSESDDEIITIPAEKGALHSLVSRLKKNIGKNV